MTDSTNTDVAYARNRIRAEAVPALRKVNSAAEEHAGRLVQSLRQDRDYLNVQAEELYRQARTEKGPLLKGAAGSHGSLVSRAAARYLREAGVTPDSRVIAESCGVIRKGCGSVNLPGGRTLRAAAGVIRLEEPATEAEGVSFSLPAAPEKDGLLANLTLPDGKKVRFQVVSAKDIESVKKIYKNDLIFCLDYDTIIGNFYFGTGCPEIGFRCPAEREAGF